MKKNNILILAGATLLLGSCSNDDLQLSQDFGYQDGFVRFTVDMPDGFATRAVSDGSSADKLSYAVFETDGTFLFQETAVATLVNKQTTVQIPLVNNKSYTVAFVATNENAPYSIQNGQFKVDYTNANANDDNYDAFYAATEVTVSPTMNAQTVTLTRPFAQVNFAANDWNTAKIAGQIISESGINFSAEVYTTMNLADGSLEGNTQSVTFAITGMPDYDTTNDKAADITVAGNNYKHVGMAYVLAHPSPATDMFTTVTYTYPGTPNNPTVGVNSVPVKRNHRTNIVGAFFTTQSTFEIIVDENFDDPDINLSFWDGVTLSPVTPVEKTIDGVQVQVYEVSTGAELAYMAQTADLKDAYIELTGNVDLGGNEWTAFGAVGRKDNDNMFTGTFDGAGFTVKNFTVEANGDEQCAAFIASADGATIKNVTLEGATVKASDTAAGLVAFIQGATKIENCNVNVNLSNIYENPGSVVIGTAVGGVVGRVYGENCVISGCTVSGIITGNSGVNAQSKIGGIVGMIGLNKAKGLIITGCTNNATMTGTSDFGFGGILGAAFKNTNVTITDCVNNGNITNNYTPFTNLTGAGGILGCAQDFNGTDNNFVITNCTNNGQIKGYNTNGVGQIIGALVNATFDTSSCDENGSATVLQ